MIRELKENVQQGVVITRDYNNFFKKVNDYKVKLESNKKGSKKICRRKKFLKLELDKTR